MSDFIVTRKWIMQHRTANRAWTNAQLNALGVEKTNGWIDRIEGKKITDAQRIAFEMNKETFAKGKKRTFNGISDPLLLWALEESGKRGIHYTLFVRKILEKVRENSLTSCKK